MVQNGACTISISLDNAMVGNKTAYDQQDVISTPWGTIKRTAQQIGKQTCYLSTVVETSLQSSPPASSRPK